MLVAMLKSKHWSFLCCDVCVLYYKSRAGYGRLFFVSDSPDIGQFCLKIPSRSLNINHGNCKFANFILNYMIELTILYLKV
jgi:hypothetical protein